MGAEYCIDKGAATLIPLMTVRVIWPVNSVTPISAAVVVEFPTAKVA
jgi:hypothetical protein